MSAARFAVAISARADQDLRNIADYVARERSLDEAIGLIDAILGKIDSLEQFPNRGSIPEEVRVFGEPDFRQTFLGPYRIFYLIEDKRVSITMIADGRRDILALLRQRLTSG